VQVDPIKPTLKAPDSKSLKLKCNTLLSGFASKSNLRCYSMVDRDSHGFSSWKDIVVPPVGWCRFPLSNPR